VVPSFVTKIIQLQVLCNNVWNSDFHELTNDESRIFAHPHPYIVRIHIRSVASLFVRHKQNSSIYLSDQHQYSTHVNLLF
jgi:hypothetical protein